MARPAAVGSWSRVWGTRGLAPGALIFGKQAGGVLWGMARCLWSLGGRPRLLVWDREGCPHAGAGRPTDDYCGQLKVDWLFFGPADHASRLKESPIG